MLQLEFYADTFLILDLIIDTPPHQSLNLMSSALDHSITSDFNRCSVTLSGKVKMEIDIRHMFKGCADESCVSIREIRFVCVQWFIDLKFFI